MRTEIKRNRRGVAARRSGRAAMPVSEALESRRMLSTSVSDFHGDSASLGDNLTETTLSPGDVNSNSFGKLFSASVDGQVYAQPLYQPAVNITSGTLQGMHNVVYVATENDTLYAFDSTTGAQLWKDSFLVSEAGLGSNVTVTTVPNADVNSSDINPVIGITSTPAIDSSTGFLYLTAETKQVVGSATTTPHYVYSLEKVNLASGAFTTAVIGDTTYNTSNGAYTYNNGPYVEDPHGQGAGVISTSINGVATNVVYFNVLRQMNRAAITLYNNNVYIAFASHGDVGPYHGWILGYNETSMAPTAALNLDPDGSDDGIWQGGGKISIDAAGNMYVETGNGTFDTTLNSSGFPEYGDYGDSFIKIALDPSTTGPNQTSNINGWGLKVVDYFTPQNQASLSSADQDMGSGSPIALPTSIGSVTLGGASDPNLLIGSGKDGVIYLINTNNMGHYSSTTDNDVQEIAGGVGGGGSYDTPALFYDGTSVYLIYSGKATNAEEYTIANGAISTTPIKSSTSFGSFGGSPMVSASGTSNGIVWLIDSSANVLRAYQADNLANELYDSGQNSARDGLVGTATKFSTAAVADGEVFVGTSNALVVYGLLAPPTSKPTAPNSLGETVISQAQINLTWTDTATNAFGYYIDESTNGGTSWTQVATAGSNASSWSVTGLQPSTTYTFEVQAYNSLGVSAFTNTVTGTTLATATPPNFTSFASAASTMSLNGNTTISGTALELTSGGGSQTSSAFTNSAFSVQGFNTTFTFQDTSATADGMTFTLQGAGPTALGGGGGDLGYEGINNSVCIKFDLYNNAGEGSDSTGLFVDGDTPEEPSGNISAEASVDMTSSGVVLNSGDVMTVNLSYNGTVLAETVTDQTNNDVFTHNYTLNIPSFIGGSYAYLGFTGATGGSSAIQKIESWSYSVVAVAPYTPTNLTVTPASGTALNLSWSDPYSTVTNYDVLELMNGSYQQIAQVPGTMSSYPVTGLSLGTTYSFEVVAVNTAGSSAPTAAVAGTTPVPPVDVSNLQYSSLTSTSINLSWTNNATNATGIDVVRQLESNNSQYLTTLSSTTTEFDDSGLLPGAEYDYEVTAVNLAGPSNGVDVVIETTPVAPTLPTASASGTSITLNWAAYGHAVALWNVYRGTTPGGESSTPYATNVPTNSFTDTDLTPGVTYYYTITAVDTGGESPMSTEVHATIGSAMAVTLSGPVNYLKLDANGDLDVYSNSTGTGTPMQYIASSVTVTGSASPSTLVVDFSAGDPLPASGLLINGSTGGAALTILGTSGNDTLNVTSSVATFDSVPLNYMDVSGITFNGGAGSDTLIQGTGAAPLAFAGTTSADNLIVDGGTYSFSAPAAGSGVVSVSLGSLQIASGAKAVLSTAAAHSDRTVLQLGTLSIAGSTGTWLGTLDLGDNDLAVAIGSIGQLNNQIAEGYSGGTWTGTGIISSAAAGNTAQLTTLGVIVNSTNGTTPLYGTGASLGAFDGLSPAASAVLIKYTYYGDTNLDGAVDGGDYSRIDSGTLSRGSQTGWFNGDLNYDGIINGSDYTLMDNAFNTQGATLAAQIASVAATPRARSFVAPNVFQSKTPITFPQSADQSIELSLQKKDLLDALSAGS